MIFIFDVIFVLYRNKVYSYSYDYFAIIVMIILLLLLWLHCHHILLLLLWLYCCFDLPNARKCWSRLESLQKDYNHSFFGKDQANNYRPRSCWLLASYMGVGYVSAPPIMRRCFGAGQFGAGHFGAGTIWRQNFFFLDSSFWSYVVSVCSSLRLR